MTKAQLGGALEGVLTHIAENTTLYTDDFKRDLFSTLEANGVKISNPAVYDIRVQLNMKLGATAPDVRRVREALDEAIQNWMLDQSPCIFPDHTGVEDDYKIISVSHIN